MGGPSHRGETTTQCTGWSMDQVVHGQMEWVPAKGGGKDRVRGRARGPLRGMGRVPINITFPPPLGGTVLLNALVIRTLYKYN
jgi:hypothetical protein